ncbi:MAG: PucR family transcriptional regulator [Pseudonocardia sp.]
MSSTGESAAMVVQRCAHELLPRSGEIAAQISAKVLARLPRLVSADSADGVDAVRESTDQNIGAILSTLAFGVPATATEPPLGARRLLRHAVQASGGQITDLLQAYRHGHELIWQRWSEHVRKRLDDAELLAEVLALSSQHIFTFIDRSCEYLAAEYRAEFGGSAQTARSPGEVIHELLEDGPVDEGLASSVLRYDVRGHHVALVLAPLSADGDVPSALAALAAVTGGAAAVSLPVGDGTWWAWFSWPAAPGPDRLATLAAVRMDGVLAGMGRPGRGRAGFRRSHLEAREADRASRLSSRPGSAVVGYLGVQLAGVLCTDPERARAFAAERLGALAGRDETCARLRETLLVYLSSGCSRARTAQALHVHHKTVNYRLTQAEQLLGRPLTTDVLELGAALLADRTLHGNHPDP